MCARWYTIIAGMSLHSVFFRNGVRRWSCRWSLQTEFVCKCLCDCWYSHWSEHDYYAYVCLCGCVWVCERWERQFWHGWATAYERLPHPALAPADDNDQTDHTRTHEHQTTGKDDASDNQTTAPPSPLFTWMQRTSKTHSRSPFWGHAADHFHASRHWTRKHLCNLKPIVTV